MSEWKIVRLGDVLIQQNKSKIKAGEGIDDGVYPFYTCSNELTKQINTAQYKGPALIFGTGGKASVHFCSGSFSTSTDCLVYKTSKEVNLSLVNKYLRKNMYLLENGFKGAGLKHISREYIANIEISLPEILEQNKLVSQFDLIESSITNHKKMLEKYDTLIKSRFIEMFGDPVENPMGWEVKKLGDICTKISDGVHAKPEYTATGKPFISVVNINSGKLLFDDCKYVSEEAYEKMIKSTHPEKGDVLYTKVGATYGIPALVDTDRAFCLYVSVALLKPKSEIVNSQFLTTSMAQPYIKNQADKRIKGIGVPDLHLNQIREFEVLVPPLELQNQFNSFVQQIDKSKFEIEKIVKMVYN